MAREQQKGNQTLKIMVFMLSVVFFVGGLLVFVVGLWLRYDVDLWMFATYMCSWYETTRLFLCSGGLSIFLAVLGCIAPIKQSHFYCVIFMILLFATGTMKFAGGVRAATCATSSELPTYSKAPFLYTFGYYDCGGKGTDFIYTHQIDFNIVSNNQRFTEQAFMKMNNYGARGFDFYTGGIDDIQIDLECCGWNSHSDWQRTSFFRENQAYPPSCCSSKKSNSKCGSAGSSFYTTGCLNVFSWRYLIYLRAIGGIGIGTGLFDIFLCIVTFFYLRSLGPSEYLIK